MRNKGHQSNSSNNVMLNLRRLTQSLVMLQYIFIQQFSVKSDRFDVKLQYAKCICGLKKKLTLTFNTLDGIFN